MEETNNQQVTSSESVEELKQKLEAAEKQGNEYLEGWRRAKADYLNYKKEENGRLEQIAKYTGEDILKEMVSVLDSFDLGLRALEKAGPVEKGVYMIRAQIEDILKKRGLERIKLAPGDPFDPMTAEAIAEGDSEHPPGTVAEEIEPGYRLYDKVLRPARVKLSKDKTTT
jgi:molecular chaperone GrpE